MTERTRIILLSAVGAVISMALAVLLFYSAFTNQSAFDVVQDGISTEHDAVDLEGQNFPVPLEVPATFRVGETLTFEGGLIATLEKIDDSRCPKDVQCVWAGELKATFILQVFGAQSESVGTDLTVALGSVTSQKAEVAGYRFMLDSITESGATIVVSSLRPFPSTEE
jgi:hypothetical protein